MKSKYPRTPHLPWSPGAASDDKVLKSVDHLLGRYVVVTEKMDGENTSMYNDGYHARSLDSRHHSSRDWLAAFHAEVSYNIPDGWRVCGENVYAKHSVEYENLQSYFLGFSLWDEYNVCLSWPTTLEYFNMLGIKPVPVLWEGVFTVDAIQKIQEKLDLEKQEGYVVRLHDEFKFVDFNKSVCKFVRKGHVQTDEHWMHREIIPNKLFT